MYSSFHLYSMLQYDQKARLSGPEIFLLSFYDFVTRQKKR